MRLPATVAGPGPPGGNGWIGPGLGTPLLAGGRAMSTTVVAPAASSSGHHATMFGGGGTQVIVPTAVASRRVAVFVRVAVRVAVLVRVAVAGAVCVTLAVGLGVGVLVAGAVAVTVPVGVGWSMLVNMHCRRPGVEGEDHLVVAGLEAAGGADGGADDVEGAGAGAERAGDVRQRRGGLETSNTSKIGPQAIGFGTHWPSLRVMPCRP